MSLENSPVSLVSQTCGRHQDFVGSYNVYNARLISLFLPQRGRIYAYFQIPRPRRCLYVTQLPGSVKSLKTENPDFSDPLGPLSVLFFGK